jgi:hypothetical protein
VSVMLRSHGVLQRHLPPQPQTHEPKMPPWGRVLPDGSVAAPAATILRLEVGVLQAGLIAQHDVVHHALKSRSPH